MTPAAVPPGDLVERVAKALYDSVNTMMSPAWEDAAPNVQGIYEIQAHAVIDAMRWMAVMEAGEQLAAMVLAAETKVPNIEEPEGWTCIWRYDLYKIQQAARHFQAVKTGKE